MSIIRQGTLPVGSLDHAITLNVQGSGGSHFETVTDTTPYLYRTSPQDVANMMKLKKVVGGTVAWNQMWNADSEVTITAGTVNNVFLHYDSFVAGHKYLATYIQKNSMGSNTRNTLAYNDGTNHYQSSSTNHNLTAGNYNWMFAPSNSKTNGSIWIWCHTSDVDVTYANPQLFDLTQMFGSTIADYIYSLEQAHAGDGVAWFKALFPKAYYSYNAGELMSVKTSAHKTVGFNQWDEEWEVGSYSTVTGDKTVWNNGIRSKNFIPVIPNTGYYVKVPYSTSANGYYVMFYDANKNYVGYEKKWRDTFTTLSNAYYINIVLSSVYGTTYNNDICINISSLRNGEYEPYEEHTYPLDSDLTLRGIPKLDADHKLYYDGDEYEPSGTVTRKYGIVDMGTLTWQRNASGDHYTFDSLAINKATGFNFICPKYPNARTYRSDLLDKQMGTFNLTSGTYRISIRDDSYSDAQTFKTAMSGVYLVYELATPTTESADAYTQAQRVGATEEFVDARTVAMPVGNESEYKRLIHPDPSE